MDKMVFDCSIERKEFIKGNDSIIYFDIRVDIDGNSIQLSFKDKDKKLAEYLLNDKILHSNKK